MLTIVALWATAITVATEFEGGSLGKVEQVGPAHLRCAVEGESDQDHRNRQANWYYFRLENLPRTPLIIDLVELAGEYNYRPAHSVTKASRPVYSYDGKSWNHFRDDQVEWDEKEIRLRLRFTPEGARMWIAHVPPYGNSDLDRLLSGFRGSPYLKRDVVGRTVEGRPMPLLTVTNPRRNDAGKKVLWLMFRQHSWETGTSWVCEGALRFLLSADQRAARLRDNAVFKIFPMADPDGVARGGVRFNTNGYDLNRNWDAVDAVKTPEIAAQRKAILGWVDAGHPIDLFFALHNTEGGEYIEGAGGSDLFERLLQILADTTTFNPTGRVRAAGATTTPGKPGRMTVIQGLWHDRKIRGVLMEQMVEYNSKLGRLPRIEDRLRFGAELVRALYEAVAAAPPA